MCGCVLDLTYHEPCLGEGIHCKYKSEVQSSTVKGSTAAHELMMWLYLDSGISGVNPTTPGKNLLIFCIKEVICNCKFTGRFLERTTVCYLALIVGGKMETLFSCDATS